ncbi:MAG: LCP family protein [Cyanobacteria bacterium]|nr:LCP family protein [Cyanobacteriota bacterium]
MTTPSLDQSQGQASSSQLVQTVAPEPAQPVQPPTVPAPRRWAQRLAWSIVFTGTAIASALGGGLLATTTPLPGWLSSDNTAQPLDLGELWQSGFRYRVTRPVNIVLMGIDEVRTADQSEPDDLLAGRTDTLLLARINPEAGKLSVLSIPRDTRVEIPGEGTTKINHANLVGGPEAVAETIQANLGPVPIDRYVRVGTGAFKELVDLVGGVQVYVPKRMVYTDHSQGLYIDLQAGWQTLNGDQAEQFARFRADAQGDIGRVQRQQMLLKALRERLTSPRIIPRLPQIIRVMLRYIDTNLSLEEVLALVTFSLELDSDSLQMVMLPGRFSETGEYNASYWILDDDASQQVMNDFFGLETVALLSNRNNRAVSQLRIAVQNASGNEDVATEVARLLRQQGFENVYVVADWPGTVRQTQVVAQRGDIHSAGVITSVLGMGEVMADSTGNIESDLTIRVGKDWSSITSGTR